MVVYKITNQMNGKCYIGSTINFKQRKNAHFNNLRKGIHHSRYLQNSFNKYGEACFSIEVVGKARTVKTLLEKEQILINTLKPEYNMCPIAGTCLGTKQSTETRDKIRLKTFKPVLQLSLEKEIIKKWPGLVVAAKALNISARRISECCRGNRRTAGGFIFEFENNSNHITYKRPSRAKYTELQRRNISAGINVGKFELTFPNGRKYRIKNLSKFCKRHGLSLNNMYQVSYGGRPHHKGYKVKRLDNVKIKK